MCTPPSPSRWAGHSEEKDRNKCCNVLERRGWSSEPIVILVRPGEYPHSLRHEVTMKLPFA
jgi:hypothetical protein